MNILKTLLLNVCDSVTTSESIKDGDKETIRDKTVRVLFERVNEYVDWACEEGLYLPPDFATDPTAWATTLRDIQRAFTLLNDELNQEGELWEAKNKWKEFGEKNVEEMEYLNKEVEKGLTLFGKYLFYLTSDTIKDRE